MKKIFGLIIIAFMIGCSSVNEPEERVDITARYQDLNRGMILLLEHNYRNVTATLEWEGITTELTGKFDYTENQVIMSGNYFGVYNISFNLIYKNKALAGGFVFNNSGTNSVRFEFVHKLLKHDQGGM